MAHFYSINSNEHLSNRVRTEFLELQAYDLLEKNIIGWKERDRLDGLLLQAILELSKTKPEVSVDGFTAWEIVESVSKLRRRRWSTENDKESMSDDVRRQWKKLEVLWKSKIEGISQSFLDEGFSKYPNISRSEGGGTGRPTKYKIEWIDFNDINLTNIGKDENQYNPPIELTVRYICEDIKDPNLLAKIFARGYMLKGWRKRVYLAAILGPVFLALIFSLIIVLNTLFTNSHGANELGAWKSIISTFIIIFSVFITLGPLYQLKEKRVILAPWWMQSVEEDRLLELRMPPRFETKNIKAVSYSADCPICGGRVFAKSGGLEFWGRIIGRCGDSPIEHTFSFDHVTRRGVYLRK